MTTISTIIPNLPYGIKIHPLYWLVPEFEKSGVYFEKYSNVVKEIHRNAFLNSQNIKNIFVPGSVVKID